MYRLVLNAGDYVRNINEASRRYRCRGVVARVSENMYHVEYDDGIKASYHKKTAHKYLEKIVEVNNQYKCVHDEVYDKCARQMQKTLLFSLCYGAGVQTLAEAYGKRKPHSRKSVAM